METESPPIPLQTGVLVMAASHIGNLDDTPNRTLTWLKAADLLIAEEPRPMRALLKRAGIHRPFLCYSEHNESETLAQAISTLRDKKSIIYVSAQGCPTLADPGRPLLSMAYAERAKIIVIPGPSSLTAALAACPFSSDSFQYAGFLPQKTEERQKKLSKLLKEGQMLIILDTPYRLKHLLEDLMSLASSRKAFIGLDISGTHEQFLIGTAASLLKRIDVQAKHNFVLIIDRA